MDDTQPAAAATAAADTDTKYESIADDIKYAGYSRFELELEFVQSLANPHYLNHLAVHKYLADPAFVAYLDYLQYFRRPQYAKYLSYPAPTLKALELLQQEQFRKDIIMPEVVGALIESGIRAYQPSD